MVKIKNKRTVARKRVAQTARSRMRISQPGNPTFGPVSTVSTAPVAIGNSMSGFKTQVLHTADGVRVVGRDYAFTPVATGTVVTWALVGGMPLTPACMPSTALRNFVQLYNKFKFNKCYFHYITSSSTSTTGDVVFYYQKNAASSQINWTSNSFLPFVLSDSQTVIGPQWTNHTVTVTPTGPFKSTDYGMDGETTNYTQGDIFLYSKTSSTESPGYVIFDYDITFKELSVNPRAGLLPIAKAQWQPVTFLLTGAATAGTSDMGGSVAISSNSTSGVGGTTISVPSTQVNDIYKCVLDITNSTFATTTAATLLQVGTGLAREAITVADGFTFYINYNNATGCYWFTNIQEALVGVSAMRAGATVTYNETIRGFIKLISYADGNLQNSY